MFIAIENVEGIQQAKQVIEEKVRHSVNLPKKIIIEKSGEKIFAYSEVSENSYTLYFDYTADCHGAKYCNLGTYSVSPGEKIERFKNRNGKIITQEVQLANQQKAYYTPSHIMADTWPTQLQWIDKKNLYTFAWRVPSENEKADILTMVNSRFK